jgi:nitrate reductase beta subunit
VALPLHEEYGTQPNVFYVPPLPGPPKYDAHGKPIPGSERIPVDYLESLFGPTTRTALATLEAEMRKKKDGKQSELMDMLIAYKHEEMFRLEKPQPAAPKLVSITRNPKSAARAAVLER